MARAEDLPFDAVTHQAIGVLMAARGVDADRAAELLLRVVRQSGTPLTTLAGRIASDPLHAEELLSAFAN